MVAGGFALAYGDLTVLLGTFACGAFGAALGPVLAIGLNWKQVTAGAAVASISVGMGLNLVLEFLAKQTYFTWLPGLPFASGVLPTAVSLAAFFTVLFVVKWVSGVRGRAGHVDEDIALIMEM